MPGPQSMFRGGVDVGGGIKIHWVHAILNMKRAKRNIVLYCFTYRCEIYLVA